MHYETIYKLSLRTTSTVRSKAVMISNRENFIVCKDENDMITKIIPASTFISTTLIKEDN